MDEGCRWRRSVYCKLSWPGVITRRNDDASDRQRGHGVVHDHRCQVSNGTETIMETSVAENANASLLTQAFKHWWASIPTGNYSTQRLCLLWRMENENEDGDYAMWNLIIFDKLMWQNWRGLDLISGICLFDFFEEEIRTDYLENII